MTDVSVTCLIAAFNEGPRIGGVLKALQGHPLVDRTIVVDDGSVDATADIARSFGVEVLHSEANAGKTAALAMGLRHICTSHVLLLDADLVGITADAVDQLLNPVLRGVADASISLRGNAPLAWRLIGIDYISGERVLSNALLAGHIERLAFLPRFGFEVFVNRLLIADKARVAIVRLPGVASPSKAEKHGFWHGFASDLGMVKDIFMTISFWEMCHQIVTLKRLEGGLDG